MQGDKTAPSFFSGRFRFSLEFDIDHSRETSLPYFVSVHPENPGKKGGDYRCYCLFCSR